MICISVLNNTNEILTVSTYLNGEYGHKDIYIGVPTIINRDGAREILKLDLSEADQAKLDNSCKTLIEMMESIKNVI